MQFDPKTETQLDEAQMIPKGATCDFEVVQAADKRSKAGNDMIEVKLRVWHSERDYLMHDYLMPSVAHKLLHFCEATGLTQHYAAGDLAAAHCVGRTGILIVGVEAAKDSYPARNKVADYQGHRSGGKPVTIGATKPAAPKAAPAADDDVPF